MHSFLYMLVIFLCKLVQNHHCIKRHCVYITHGFLFNDLMVYFSWYHTISYNNDKECYRGFYHYMYKIPKGYRHLR